MEFQHGNLDKAVSYLQEGLHIAEQISQVIILFPASHSGCAEQVYLVTSAS